MNKLFSGFQKKPAPRQPVVVVSGLPRSGTSMMMKILAEGGLPIVTDHSRTADEDNPNGYFELELVKQMSEGNVEWLRDAGGKAVKVISALLEHLPQEYSYKVIFMEREVREILASQRKMLEHRNEELKAGDVEIEQQFQRHLSALKPWLARQPNMEVLYVSYNALIADPELFCQRLIEFTNAPLDLGRMLSVPNEELYRNRASGK
ncbi:MAG TPA: sulfotransferase [Anaerolineales bacterium]|nr:sulfotransferase [Anaerolineales bacterium]